MRQERQLSEKQLEAYNILTDKNRVELCYGGGARSGKSVLGAFWVVTEALKYKGSRWLIGRQSLKSLYNTTFVTLTQELERLELKRDADYHLNLQRGVLTFNNGSMIYFIELATLPSDSEFNRLGSYDLTGVWIDEAQEVSKKAKDTLQARLSLLQGEGWSTQPKALYTCNPAKGWIYDDFWKPIIKDRKKIRGKEFIPALYSHNPWVPHNKYKKTILGTKNKIIIERLLYGNFEYDDDKTKIMEYDAICDLFTNTVESSTERYISCDVAGLGKDLTVIGVWEGLRLIKIFSYEKTTTPDVVRYLKDLARDYKVPYSHIVIDEDGIGHGTVHTMSGTKGFVGGSTPIEEGGMKPNYLNLRSQVYFRLADYVNNHKISLEILHDDTSVKERIMNELDAIRQVDKDGKLQIISKDKLKELLGKSPDYADMLAMRMIFEIDEEEESEFFFLA